MKSCACASRAAASICALRGRFARAKGDIFGDRAREQKDVLFDRGDLRAQAVQAPVAHIHAVDPHAADAGVEGAVEQLGQRALARAGLPDDGDGLPGRGVKRDIV